MRFRPSCLVPWVVACLVGLVCAPLADAQGTWRASVDSAGSQSNNPSYTASISSDGRFVAFWSLASNLVAGDNNGFQDVFVHDRQTRITSRVSVDSSGVEGDNYSRFPVISADGRFVAFESMASNLVAGDTNGLPDVFVHDRDSGVTTRVSVTSAGAEADSDSYSPSISANGRFVAFSSLATNLAPFDANRSYDVFVHDRDTGATDRVSVTTTGFEANNSSVEPSISADGQVVAFLSFASNLVANDLNGSEDVFVRDILAGTTTRLSVDSIGVEANAASIEISISADGAVVAFSSFASNLVQGDANGQQDVFVHDRQTASTTRVSVSSNGAEGNSVSANPSISADGRLVAFSSLSDNLVPSDGNSSQDVFVHDRQTGATSRVSVDSSGAEGNSVSLEPSISADGRFVAFDSSSTNLVAGDTNGLHDVFVRGPHLVLEAIPEAVAAGSNLAITTWGGKPGSLALLAVVDLNGTPLFLTVLVAPFDSNGILTLSAVVPPGLSGNVVTFFAFGIAPTGKVESTNREAVSFQ